MNSIERARILGTTLTIAAAASACGGPSIEQVRADFENPSGLTANERSVMAAHTQVGASGPVRTLGAVGLTGQGLQAQGDLRGFSEIGMLRRWQPRLERNYRRLAGGSARALRTAQVETGCDETPEAQAAEEELFRQVGGEVLAGSGSAKADVSYSIDLAACSAGSLTGSVDIEVEVEVEESRIRFFVSETFHQVCETDESNACLDGTLLLEAEAIGEASGVGGDLSFLVAYDLDGSWSENGERRQASLKGGVRLRAGATANGAYGSIEHLIYATTPEGEEVSFVYQLRGEIDGNGARGSLLIRGSDGQIECTATEEMVSCTGTAEHSWSTEEQLALSQQLFGG